MSRKYDAVVLADGPRGYWPLTENSGLPQDRSGNGNHVTSVGAGVIPGNRQQGPIKGINDSVPRFTGATSATMTVPDVASLDLGDVFTLEAWAYVSAFSADEYIFDKGANAYLLRITTAGAVELMQSGGAAVASSSINLVTGTWYHIVATKSGATRAVYVNGADVSSLPANVALVDNANNLLFGDQAASSGALNGFLCRLAVYGTALTAAQVKRHYYAGINPDLWTPPAVRIRNPFPPHQALLDLQVEGLTYGFMFNRQQTAAFRIPRADPQLDAFGDLISVGSMVSIERADELWPWVGFITEYDDDPADPFIQMRLRDCSFLLSQARLQWGGSGEGSSGRVIRNALSEANARAEPPLLIDLSLVGDAGPRIVYDFKGDNALQFLTRVATATGWEWQLIPAVDATGVRVYLHWRERLGRDRGVSVRWEEGMHLQQVKYSARANAFFSASFMTGGAGDFDNLVAVAAVGKRAVAGVDESVSVDQTRDTDVRRSPALMGTRQHHEYQVTTLDALRAGARRLLDAPDYVGEQISFGLLESTLELDELQLGDVVTVQTQTTLRPMKRFVRVLGLGFDGDDGVLAAEAQIVGRQSQ